MPDRPIAILSISSSPAISGTRRLILEQHGYEVAEAADFVDIEQKCRENHYRCAILGTDIDPRMKRAIALALKRFCPEMPILEIIRLSSEINGAATVASDSPEALLKAVDDLLIPNGVRYTEQLHRRTQVIWDRAAQAFQEARNTRAQTRDIVAEARKLTQWRKNKKQV